MELAFSGNDVERIPLQRPGPCGYLARRTLDWVIWTKDVRRPKPSVRRSGLRLSAHSTRETVSFTIMVPALAPSPGPEAANKIAPEIVVSNTGLRFFRSGRCARMYLANTAPCAE